MIFYYLSGTGGNTSTVYCELSLYVAVHRSFLVQIPALLPGKGGGGGGGGGFQLVKISASQAWILCKTPRIAQEEGFSPFELIGALLNEVLKLWCKIPIQSLSKWLLRQ